MEKENGGGVDIDAMEGFIAIQLDDLTKTELLMRGTSVVKKCSSWVVVEKERESM